jgi:hypothetical protein
VHQVDNQAQVTKTTWDISFLVTVAPLKIDFLHDYARLRAEINFKVTVKTGIRNSSKK